MRPRPILWFVICLICLAGARYFWQLGDRREEQRRATVAAQATNESGAMPVDNTSTNAAATAPATSQTQPAAVSSSQAVAPNPGGTNHLDYRVTNTTRTSSQLLRNDRALLLENALLETGGRVTLSIPDKLRARANSGTYIVQADQPLDNAFRALLKDAGAEIVSFIPNNAYLVRMSPSSVAQVESSALTHAVMDYEPYYKLKWPLLKVAADDTELPDGTLLNLLVFADARERTLAQLEQLGAKVLGEDRSIFLVHPRSSSLADIAALPGVQIVELNRKRAPANDLSRERVGVAINSTIQTNFLGLTGAGVIVDVNDTGVDATHPDLVGRVTGDLPSSLVDFEGHGTHVAATIAGDGMESLTVTNASGSVMPAVDGQFRGMAPAANIYSVAFADNFAVGPYRSDAYLQEEAANTNALISNNSWGLIGDYSYDLAAASYDAAVRDSLPEKTGSQPVLYVFAAGNDGDGNEGGTGGFPGSINSPATAKNVIAVGALEQLRNITNRIVVGEDTNGTAIWEARTDSDDQVARYSGRGNVGIGIEGDFGRFKPDLVAPGSFLLSARSAQWDENAYYNSTNHHINLIPFEVVGSGQFLRRTIFVPENAVQLTIRLEPNVLSPDPFPDLPIYMADGYVPTTANFVGFNEVSLPPDLALVTDTTWYYSIGNNTTLDANFHIFTDIITTNDFGDYYEVLKNMNDSIGSRDAQGNYPYRYESGTSMATPVVSGTLALMQEFLQQRLSVSPSPALMKALLINGAVRVNNIYNYAVRANVNDEGWGLVYLPNSLMDGSNALAEAESALRFYDQSPTESLATGESRTWLVEVPVDSQGSPMRFTLVWTDPPGNPVAGVKLVNDLDLVVTNLDTGDVYLGNDFVGDVIVYPWQSNSIPNIDSVNNVENVYLSSGLDAHYSVTVVGHRVNVNAVTADPDNTAQDFALVISCGDADNYGPSPVIVDSAQPIQTATRPLVTTLTNTFNSETDVGSMLLGQHVGASSPLLGLQTIPAPPASPGAITLGQTNQWHFYVLTNTTEFTNAAFVTFLPPNLAIPRMGVFSELPSDDSRIQADIDLYVAVNQPELTNLNPAVLATCQKSLTRGGTEFIVYSNAMPGDVYYIGVKSEDQMVAEYGFLGVFSLEPFSSDENGNTIVRGIPIPSVIPDGSNPDPGIAYVIGISLASSPVRRVIVTNTITHDNLGDLFVKVLHDNESAVLLNHQAKPPVPPGPAAPGPYYFVFEDNGEGDPDDFARSDGPGTLRNFVGTGGVGVWIYAALDDAPGNTGTVDRLTFRLEPQNTDGETEIGLEPNSFYFDFIDVPPEATNLTVCISQNSGPLVLFLLRDDFATTNGFLQSVIVPPGGGCLSSSIYDIPPLTAGRYFIAVFNPNDTAVSFYLTATLGISAIPATPLTLDSVGNEPILDDAVTYSSLFVTNDARIARTEVGLRVDHERASDLAITLVSPLGKRILLVENRGNTNMAGFGSTLNSTNVFPATSAGDFNAATNVITTTLNQGTLLINYDFINIPDEMTVYYNGSVIFDSGLISGTGQFTINYGPGPSTDLAIVMNQGGSPNTNPPTAWTYNATVVSQSSAYLILTENTNRTTTPIKFAPFPLAPIVTSTTTNIVGTNVTLTTIMTTNVMTTNITVWHSSFELPPYGELSAGIYLGEGWYISSGTVDDFSPAPSGRYEGNYVMDINGNSLGTVLTNIATIVGRQYTLSFAYTKNWNAPSAAAEVSISGSVLASLTDNLPNSEANPNWKLGSFPLTTQGNSMQVMVRGLSPSSASGMLFDAFNLEMQEETQEIITNSFYVTNFVYNYAYNLDDYYYLPEESLDVLIGDNAFGEWKLELWDNRVGAYINGSTFVDWSLFFVFERTQSEVIPLPPDTIVTNVVPPNSIIYYSVNVPTNAISATNILVFADGPVNMLFNQINLPTGTTIGDFTLLANSTGGRSNLVIGGTPPLLPGQTYYLGIQNNNSTNVTVAVQVSFGYAPVTNNTDIVIIDVSVVTNSLCLTWTSVVGQIYYVEGLTNLASTNWVAVSPTIVATNTLTTYCVPIVSPYEFFRVIAGVSPISPPSTNIPPGSILDFVITVPPTATSATNILVFASSPVNMFFNQTNPPTGSNAGDFTFLTNSISGSYLLLPGGTPPLVPGQTYHLGIQNTNAGPVTVAVQVDFGYEPLTNGPVIIIDVSIVTNSLCLTWASVPGQSYYVEGLADLGTTNWVAVSPTIVATTNETTYCVPLPTPYRFFRVIAGVSPILPPGIPPGVIHDFLISVPTNATSATNILVFADGPVNMFFNQTNTPTGTSLGDYQFLTNSIGGSYLLLPGGTPPLVPGQTYHLGIQNLNTSNINVTIQVDFGYELVITNPPVVVIDVSIVTNSLCLTWASVPGQSYYVEGLADLGTTNWVAVSPTIVATTNETTYCVPLPTPYNFFRVIAGVSPILPPSIPPDMIQDFLINVPTNATSATNILVFADGPVNMFFNQTNTPTGSNAGDFTFLTNSIGGSYLLLTGGTPPLVPGQTYHLGIQNLNTSNINVTIQVDFGYEPVITNPPVVVIDVSIVTNSLCLTWASVPGQSYFVEGLVDLGTTNWTAVSPTIVTTTNETTYCVPLPSAYNFFRVTAGTSPITPPVTNPPVVVIDVSIVTNSLCLTWVSLAGQSYYVEGLVDLGTTNWTAVSPTIVATTNETTYCVPLPSAYNFFRVIAGTSPITPPVTNPPVDVTDVFVQTNSLCLTWVSLAGQSYYVEGLVDLGTTNWTAVSPTIVATTNETTYCVPLPSPYNFFRVVAGVSPITPPVTNPPVVVVGVSIVTNSFCLTWSSVAAQSYYVEGLADLGTTNWAAVSPTIIATNSQTTYCVPLPSAYNFFRVVAGLSSLSTTTYEFTSIVPGPGGVTLTWFAPTNLQFNILWTANIALQVSSWTTIASNFTSTNGTFVFTDDGSLTGGSGGLKFYQLQQIP